MIYLTSDLHGYPLEKFLAYLESVNFCSTDYLYILGDCIDRGKDGIRILRWLMQTDNAELIAGNHEAMFSACSFLFEDYQDYGPADMNPLQEEKYKIWMSNSGYVTLNELQAMRNDAIRYILRFIDKAPLYKEITVNGRDFILTHSGLGNFRPDKKLSEYTKEELLWHRPDPEEKYFEDKTVIFGHTPTFYLDENFKGRAYKTKYFIDIDTGAGKGLAPMLLRLDDMKEFYF